MMKTIYIAAYLILGVFFLNYCKNQENGQEFTVPPIAVRAAPVTEGTIEDYLLLNGKTLYLKKDKIVSPISAFVTKVHVQYGDIVQEGDVLFELQTMENRALNNNQNDLQVLALSEGSVSELVVNQPGTYLMEGDLLCLLVENKDLVIQVNVPYEYNNLLKQGTRCRILLPDQTVFTAAVTTILPAINETDQTQTVLVKSTSPVTLPENLNLSVQFTLNSHSRSYLVPSTAVMTNEKQTIFWLMKIVQDSLAVQIPVKKGIENDSMVEIISPDLITGELIITEGAFGLPDSSIVKLTD